jgi:hypothetical protein
LGIEGVGAFIPTLCEEGGNIFSGGFHKSYDIGVTPGMNG